jgi:hypothetical protein
MENESMNEQENQKRTNQEVKLEDLPVEVSAQQEVNGGPRGTVERNDSVQILLNTTY